GAVGTLLLVEHGGGACDADRKGRADTRGAAAEPGEGSRFDIMASRRPRPRYSTGCVSPAGSTGGVSPAGEVLPGPRAPPRGHDRLLRAALVRAADLSRALAARADRARRRVELPRDGVEEGLSRHLGLGDREGGPIRAAERSDPGNHRRHRFALD